MSTWQYTAAVEGYAKAHDPDGDSKLSAKEQDEIWDLIKG